jgi:hypothetical protein
VAGIIRISKAAVRGALASRCDWLTFLSPLAYEISQVATKPQDLRLVNQEYKNLKGEQLWIS